MDIVVIAAPLAAVAACCGVPLAVAAFWLRRGTGHKGADRLVEGQLEGGGEATALRTGEAGPMVDASVRSARGEA